jgi:hypothetical protein
MLGLASSLRAVGRERTIGLAIATLIGVAVLVPSSAHASGCTDSWTNNKGGSWFTPGNWSKGVPTSADEACITENGTYTVEMTQSSSTVSLKALTVGGTSGTQTLAVGSSVSLNAILATTAGITNGAQGAITLTNGDSAGNSVAVTGPITNSGTITSEPAHGGGRTLEGSLANTGTLAINTNTSYDAAGTVLSNEGAINLAEGKALSVFKKSSITNGAGGKIAATGTGDVFVEGAGTSFTEGAGTTSGTKPVIVDDSTLTYTGTGASLIALRGTSSLGGTSSSGQSLSIESTVSENAIVTAATGFANGGSITLTNGDSASTSATLAVTTGTLSNSGTITTEPAHGGARTIQGNLTNTGTIAINANTSYNGASALLMNEGAINLAEGKELAVSNKGSVTNGSGGKIVATGSGDVLMEPGTSFTEGAGTTSGTKPVIVRDGALSYTGAGSSAIAVHGEGGTLSGNLSSGQSLSIESTIGEHAKVTVGAGFSNAGSITLTNGDTASNNATLVISTGTLSNSGTITTEPAHGGARTIQGNITNTGTIAINANTSYSGASAVLMNEGAINLAEGKELAVSNKGSVTNGSGGKIVGTGSGNVFVGSGTSFTEGAGTTSGSQPVIVDDATLTYTGSGASVIALRGTSSLPGSLAAGQSLVIQSTCFEHAVATAATGITNNGSITLTNGDGCANNATLAVSSGTLTNGGTITTEPANGGARTLQGNITNTGKLVINANTTDNAASPTLLNEGAINVATGVALSAPSKPTISNETGGTIAGAGTGALVQTGGTFSEGLGKTTGSEPVILDDLALQYTNKGASTIALRGTSTLSGTINAGQVLSLQSSLTEHAVVTAAGSFVNSGTLDLTNGDGAGNNVTLNLAGGTLENKGTLNSQSPHGGSRTIEGSLKNEKTLSLSAAETLKVTGTCAQGKKGTLKTAIASATNFGALSVTGAATLAGNLGLTQTKPFLGKAGQTFAILTSSTRTGTFAKETGASIAKTVGLYYKPTYPATGVALVVTQASVVPSPTEGLPGSAVTLKGSSYPPEDTIKLSFTDHGKVKTVFPSAKTNAGGEFSAEITIPVGAATGGGKITATSTLVGVAVNVTFTVT